MIKAAELRIGQYYNVPNPSQSPFRVDCIDHLHPADGFGKVGMFVKGFENAHPLTWYLKDLDPIPLTEEWMLKAGFQKVVWEDNGKPYCTLWKHDHEHMPFLDTDFALDGTNSKPMAYVHQLQNLFFALTGDELEF
jgi:hypothetical protein